MSRLVRPRLVGCSLSRAARRGLAVCALLAAMLLAGLFAGAVPASAHAVLQNSDPLSGAALDAAPERVTLSFSESVRVDADSIRVLDTSGTRIDDGAATHGERPSEATVALRGPLEPGTYLVNWRVVSADNHPVAGAFAFGVGGPPDAAAAAGLSSGGSKAVGTALGVARFAAFTGAVLLIGVPFFLLVLWPQGRRRAGARRLVAAGWGLSLAAAVALLLLQGPYTAGLGMSGVFRWDPLAATLDDRFGHLIEVRILVLLLAAPLLLRLVRGPKQADGQQPGGKQPDGRQPAREQGGGKQADGLGRWYRFELATLGVALSVTFAMIGHGGAGDLAWLASASMTLHMAAMAVWLGGLAVLAAFLLVPVRAAGAGSAPGGPDEGPVPPERAAELARVLPRWSTTAMAAVVVIVLSGAYQTWREVRALGALIDTTYGRLLLYKLWFVLGALALGLLAQRWVRRQYRPVVRALAAEGTAAEEAAAGGEAGREARVPSPPTASGLATLRRGVVLEVLAGAVILGVTAVLVNTIPAADSYAPPYAERTFAGPLTVEVEVEPTRAGPQTIHVYTYDPQGRPQDLVEASGELTLPSAGVGPIDIPLVEAEPGHVLAENVAVPLPGEWQLRFTLRINDFDQYVTTVFYTVR